MLLLFLNDKGWTSEGVEGYYGELRDTRRPPKQPSNQASKSANTHTHTCARPNNMCAWPEIHMHTSNKHTHKTRGAYMPTNGGDELSGPIQCGGAGKQGMWVRSGPDRRYLSRMTTTRKQQTKKKHNKPARKHTNKINTTNGRWCGDDSSHSIMETRNLFQTEI